MERRESLSSFAETLKHDALQLEAAINEKRYDAAWGLSRRLLSTASRIHQRVTSICQAQEELRDN